MPFSANETYMLRCLQLAEKGIVAAPPNPLVGAVLVHQHRIIGEGWHAIYGEAHAEVNCMHAVKPEHRALIAESTLYVSLEPCTHQGKTPPCTDLIIQKKIPQVVIGCTDPFSAVNGKGIARLREAGITVTTPVLEKECQWLNRRFFHTQTRQQPYIVLKWAQTADGFMGSGTTERLMISNAMVQRLVHRWRTEEMAILVGFNTARFDNPQLTSRLWPGRQPLRLVADPQLQLSQHLHLFADGQPTVVFNQVKTGKEGAITYLPLLPGNWAETLQPLLAMGIQSILVEGGARTLESFIQQGMWNEARMITAEDQITNSGLRAPVLATARPWREEWLGNNQVRYFTNTN